MWNYCAVKQTSAEQTSREEKASSKVTRQARASRAAPCSWRLTRFPASGSFALSLGIKVCNAFLSLEHLKTPPSNYKQIKSHARKGSVISRGFQHSLCPDRGQAAIQSIGRKKKPPPETSTSVPPWPRPSAIAGIAACEHHGHSRVPSHPPGTRPPWARRQPVPDDLSKRSPWL